MEKYIDSNKEWGGDPSSSSDKYNSHTFLVGEEILIWMTFCFAIAQNFWKQILKVFVLPENWRWGRAFICIVKKR